MVYKMRYRSQHPYSIKEKQMKSEVLSVKEKIGYGMGDAASHIIFDNVMLYMMFFYTDIFGIPAGFVGTMFLVARALDAISDPCMGLLADRTRSRWGKFRPWVLCDRFAYGICHSMRKTFSCAISGYSDHLSPLRRRCCFFQIRRVSLLGRFLCLAIRRVCGLGSFLYFRLLYGRQKADESFAD